jgi:hypothetical protein
MITDPFLLTWLGVERSLHVFLCIRFLKFAPRSSSLLLWLRPVGVSCGWSLECSLVASLA